MSPARQSPCHDELCELGPTWLIAEDMQVAVRLGADVTGASDRQRVRVADLSFLRRMGLKGPKAEAWLEQQGVATPPGVNRWLRTAEGVLVARLGRSEFLLEDAIGGRRVEALRRVLAYEPGVYPVLRQDAALALVGEGIEAVLRETCSVNFAAYAADDACVVLTQLAGVSVSVFWEPDGNARRYRIFTDASVGSYLFSTLLALAEGHGGGASGLYAMFPEALRALESG